jgi:hypothetical protein
MYTKKIGQKSPFFGKKSEINKAVLQSKIFMQTYVHRLMHNRYEKERFLPTGRCQGDYCVYKASSLSYNGKIESIRDRRGLEWGGGEVA